MSVSYVHVTTSDGAWLYTADGYPIVVAVYDPLEIVCPNDIHVTTPINTSVKVTWANPAITGGVPPYTFSSSPESDSNFSVGTTLVTITAEDSLGNTVNCSFDVTVSLMAATGCNTGLSNGFVR